MKAEDVWRIRLVAPAVWQAELRDIFDNSYRKERDLVYAIISILHSRHVGITPELAADTARLLLPTSAALRTRSDIWEGAIDSMRDIGRHLPQRTDNVRRGIGQMTPEPGAQDRHPLRGLQLGLLPQAALGYVILRVVMPLVMQACASPDMGESLLFCEDPEACDVHSPDEYRTYAQHLREKVLQLIRRGDGDEFMGLFWRDRAFTLLDITRHRTHADVGTLPENTLPESRIFFNLQPIVGSRRSQPGQSLDLSTHQRLFDPHLTNPGADGAKLTRRQEELDRILKSEFIYPKAIRLDRLLNTGYWAIRRPPQPIQTRDVLVVGMCPGQVTSFPSSVFLKTCWFHLTFYLGRLLQHNGLKLSEFRWIEGDDLDRLRINTLLVQHLPDVLTRIDEQNIDTNYYHVLKTSGWFPSYLDPSQYYTSPYTLKGTGDRHDTQEPHTRIRRWFKSAWRAQRELIAWDQPVNAGYDALIPPIVLGPVFGDKQLQHERFKFIYVMLFAPSTVAPDKPKNAKEVDERFQEINRRYRYYASAFRGVKSVMVTGVPENVYSHAWYTAASGYVDHSLLPDSSSLRTRMLAGGLIDNWLDDFVRGIRNV